jgi:hypothetical protein
MYERYRVLKYYSMMERRYMWGVYDLDTPSPHGETMTKVFSGTAPEARARCKELNKAQVHP